MQIISDEAEGELFITAVLDEKTEQDIVYDGMYYSQLDETNQGLTITSVTEITLVELKRPEHQKAAALLYDDCGNDNAFFADMLSRGNHLFVHRTEEGVEYIVLAKRLAFGELRPGDAGGI